MIEQAASNAVSIPVYPGLCNIDDDFETLDQAFRLSDEIRSADWRRQEENHLRERY